MRLGRHRPALVIGGRTRGRPALRPGMDCLSAKNGVLTPCQTSCTSLCQAEPLLHCFSFLPAQELGSLEAAERVKVIAKHEVLGGLRLAFVRRRLLGNAGIVASSDNFLGDASNLLPVPGEGTERFPGLVYRVTGDGHE